MRVMNTIIQATGVGRTPPCKKIHAPAAESVLTLPRSGCNAWRGRRQELQLKLPMKYREHLKNAEKMMLKHLPGDWKPDKWSRGGKVAYKGQPQCDWRRRMTKDGKQIVRLIQYKNIWILQKAVMLGPWS